MAIAEESTLSEVIENALSDDVVDYARVIAARRLLTPFDHPDPAHLLASCTGLTHLGSAATRAEMHHAGAAESAPGATDSMKLFHLGLDQGKPADGSVGVQPE